VPRWPCLLRGDSEISTDTCEEGQASNLLYRTAERRLHVQKVELPESSDPGRKYNPKEAEAAWKEFFAKFPDLKAWELSFSPKTRADGSVESVEDQLVDTLSKAMSKDEGGWEKAA